MHWYKKTFVEGKGLIIITSVHCKCIKFTSWKARDTRYKSELTNQVYQGYLLKIPSIVSLRISVLSLFEDGVDIFHEAEDAVRFFRICGHDRANILPRLASSLCRACSASSHPLTLHSLKQIGHSKYWPVYPSALQASEQWSSSKFRRLIGRFSLINHQVNFVSVF